MQRAEYMTTWEGSTESFIFPSHLFLFHDICLYPTIVCSLVVVSPHLRPLRINITFYQIKAAIAEVLIHIYHGPSAHAISQ